MRCSPVARLVFGLDVQAARLPEVAGDFEGGVSGGDEVRVVLHDDRVAERIAVGLRVALIEREAHGERALAAHLGTHKAWLFLVVEASSRVHHAREVCFSLQVDEHRARAALQVNVLQPLR